MPLPRLCQAMPAEIAVIGLRRQCANGIAEIVAPRRTEPLGCRCRNRNTTEAHRFLRANSENRRKADRAGDQLFGVSSVCASVASFCAAAMSFAFSPAFAFASAACRLFFCF